VVIFLLGLFWKPATEAGALAATIGSFALSLILKLAMPELPFMDRMGVVFLLALGLAVVVSLIKPVDRATNTIQTGGMSYATTLGWNVGAIGVVMILAALYTTWW